MHSGLAQLFPHILHNVRQSCAWRCCSLYTQKHFPVQWAVLTLLWGCERRGHGKRTSGRFQQRGPLAVACLSIVAQSASPKTAAPGVSPGTSGSSQLHDIPVPLLVSPAPFLNHLRLWASWLGTGLVPALVHLLQPQLPNLLVPQYKPVGTMVHRNQFPGQRRSRCLWQLGRTQMSGPRAWQCCQGGQDELCAVGMKEIPTKCRIDTGKMQGASPMWNRRKAEPESLVFTCTHSAVAYADKLRDALANKVKRKKIKFSSTV